MQREKINDRQPLDGIELAQTSGGVAMLNPDVHILPFPWPKWPPYPIGGPIKLPIIQPIDLPMMITQ